MESIDNAEFPVKDWAGPVMFPKGNGDPIKYPGIPKKLKPLDNLEEAKKWLISVSTVL